MGISNGLSVLDSLSLAQYHRIERHLVAAYEHREEAKEELQQKLYQVHTEDQGNRVIAKDEAQIGQYVDLCF